MPIKISQMDEGDALTGDELVEITVLSAVVTLTASTISALASDNSYNHSGSGWISAGFAVGDAVRVAGFTGNVANNVHSATITALTSSKMTIGGTDGDVIVDDAAGESVTITKWLTRRTTAAEIAALFDASAIQGNGLDVDACGFRGIPQNPQTGNYTCVAADAGKEIYHSSSAGAGDTYTIPANSSVAYEIGTCITFTNLDTNPLSIAITTDTMHLAGVGTTGTRTLAQFGIATAKKITSTAWLISGVGLT